MKNETKGKILRWISKVLRYKEEFPIFLEVGTVKLRLVRWNGILNKRDADIHLRKSVAHHLLGVLLEKDSSAIKITVTDVMGGNKMKVQSRLYYVNPTDNVTGKWEETNYFENG